MSLTLSKYTFNIHIYYSHTPSSLVILVVIRVDNLLTLCRLLLSPVESTLGTDEDQVHAVLGRVHESHSLVVTALLASEVLPSRESWVLDALLVNVKEELGARVASPGCLSRPRLYLLTRPVDAVIGLVTGFGLLEVSTDAAVIDESADYWVLGLLLLGLQHVVALSAEAHALKSCHLAENLTLLIIILFNITINMIE